MRNGISVLAAIALAIVTLRVGAWAGDDPKLLAQAKVDRDVATRTALARVPHGIVASSEIEREHGRLIWSFDIKAPKATSVTEVNVDARTGRVVAVHTESPVRERKEAAEDGATR